MKYARLVTLITAAALLAGCGGDDRPDVPNDAVAAVGDETITRAEFDDWFSQARCRFRKQRSPFPKAGTAEYRTLQNQVVQNLVLRAQYAQKADELGVEVTDKQVQDRLSQIKQQFFGGKESRYRAGLAAQCLNQAQAEATIRDQLVSMAVFNEVTGDVKVSDQDVQAYYNKNKRQYTSQETRDVRHVLVKNKALADRLHSRLRGGESFAAIARRYSQDPGTKAAGGRLTIARGQTEAPFDKAAFALRPGQLSRPVKTQFGYHIIQALTSVRPAKTTPFSQLKESIRQQLLQTRKTDAMTKWLSDTRKEFDSKTAYRAGFQPPSTTGTTTAQTNE